MASWASSRSGNRASSRAEAERSPGSVSWQSRMDDSARNSVDGSTNRSGDRRSEASERHDDSASRRYGETDDVGSVSKSARPLAPSRRFTAGSDLRDRKHVGRPGRGHGEPSNAVTVSKHFVVFVCAGLAFFGLSVLGAGRSNRAFERHFQEIAKVRADRRMRTTAAPVPRHRATAPSSLAIRDATVHALLGFSAGGGAPPRYEVAFT